MPQSDAAEPISYPDWYIVFLLIYQIFCAVILPDNLTCELFKNASIYLLHVMRVST